MCAWCARREAGFLGEKEIDRERQRGTEICIYRKRGEAMEREREREIEGRACGGSID